MIPQKTWKRQQAMSTVPIILLAFGQKHNYPIFIDQSALELDQMIVSAGEVGHSIQIKAQDLADFVKASFEDLVE